MRVTVLLFASYADALGTRTLALELPAASGTRSLLDAVRALPGAEQLPPAPLVAVNERYARGDAPLSEGDVVALLPPVAGG